MKMNVVAAAGGFLRRQSFGLAVLASAGVAFAFPSVKPLKSDRQVRLPSSVRSARALRSSRSVKPKNHLI